MFGVNYIVATHFEIRSLQACSDIRVLQCNPLYVPLFYVLAHTTTPHRSLECTFTPQACE